MPYTPKPERPVALHHEEARHLLAVGGGLRGALELLMTQFNVLQTRAQVLLTVSTLALTITGFSGPRIAQSGDFPRLSMAVGLVFVLASMLLILGGSLRIRWVTQFRAPAGSTDETALVAEVVCHRDRKTRLFFVELCLLLAGLSAYVAAVIAYFLFGAVA
jgi:hypothetical protein